MAQTTAFFATHSDRCLARTHADDQYTYESHLHAFIFDKTTINQWKHAFLVLSSVSDHGGSAFSDAKDMPFCQYRNMMMSIDEISVNCCVHVAPRTLQEPKSPPSWSAKKPLMQPFPLYHDNQQTHDAMAAHNDQHIHKVCNRIADCCFGSAHMHRTATKWSPLCTPKRCSAVVHFSQQWNVR